LYEQISFLVAGEIFVDFREAERHVHPGVLTDGKCLVLWDCARYSQQLLNT